MMVSCLTLSVLVLCLLFGLVQGTDEDEKKYWGKSPLPIFTRVEIEHNDDRNSTHIRVRYKSNERPHYRWFINDIPFVGGIGDYFVHNFYDGYMLCMTSIIVPDALGRRYKVCLQTEDAQNCLHLRPLSGVFEQQGEDLDFPWPLLVPSPIARYNTNRKVRIFVPQLDTWNYTYSGQFFFQPPGYSQPLRQSEFRMGDEGGDVISMAPVTSGSPGWILEVATDRAGYEGVVLFQTTIEPPPSALAIVERTVSTRSINIYNRQHSAPFHHNYAAMLPHQGESLSASCRSQKNLFCLLACPFAVNGDLYEAELHVAQVYDNGTRVVPMPRSSLFGQARKTGEYLAETMFQLNVSDDAEAGVYQCSVTLGGNTTQTSVTLTLV